MAGFTSVELALGTDFERWEHQKFGFSECVRRIDMSQDSVVCTPTGGGKTWTMIDIICWCLNQQKSVAIYITRILLFDQLHRVFSNAGLEFGVIASGREDEEDLDAPIQLCMTQTVASWMERKGWSPSADVVLIEECHIQRGQMMMSIAGQCRERGGVVVGITATPLGLSEMFQAGDLIVAGTIPELQQKPCNALVPAHVYAPSEIDTRRLRRQANGEFSAKEINKRLTPHVFGDIFKHWKRLNPDGGPTLLFGPDVRGSRWYAVQFKAHGVRAAHIDGNEIVLDGKRIPATRETRDMVSSQFEDGSIQVLCNNMVLREGIDWPFVSHCILGTSIGSLASYLQTVGRALRAHPSLDHVTVQDHGGNFWRHDSPNKDRTDEFVRYFDLPAKSPTDARCRRMAEFRDRNDTWVCPECGGVTRSRREGVRTGFCKLCKADVQGILMRRVIQMDGTLSNVGYYVKPLNVRPVVDQESKWKRIYFSFRKSGKTFTQAEGYFVHLHNAWPPRNIKFMPKAEEDWFRKIADVSYADLY